MDLDTQDTAVSTIKKVIDDDDSVLDAAEHTFTKLQLMNDPLIIIYSYAAFKK